MIAPKLYPPIDQPQRWCRNGQVPDAYLLRRLVNNVNHVMAYRRKTFCRWGDCDNTMSGATGTVKRFRFRCHVGYGCSKMGFTVGIARDNSGFGASSRVVITATIAGGASSTRSLYPGLSSSTAAHTPDGTSWYTPTINVTANTTYEVLVESIDFARVAHFSAYEIAPSEVDSAVDYFHELQPGIEQPILDSIRERIFTGMTAIYKRNGAHLYSFLGNGNGSNPTFTGTTWTNVIDGTTTSTAEAAGIYLAEVTGGGPYLGMRLSDAGAPSINAVLAVYGQVTAGGNGGEVRLYDDAEGVIATITGITTTEQWHTTTVALPALDTIEKLVLQARHSTALNTLRVDAVSLYAYEA
jgi:transposase